MKGINFIFSDNSFNNIFPFYILIDENLVIKSFGKSLSKILPDLVDDTAFIDNFFVKRPFVKHLVLGSMDELIHQLVIVESIRDSTILLKGQFEPHNGGFLFVGSPWFSSVEEVTQKN